MHAKISFKTSFCGLVLLVVVLSLVACGFKPIGHNILNPAITSVCIHSDNKTQFRQRLIQNLKASEVQVSDVPKSGCAGLALTQETVSEDPQFGDATQARTYAMDFSVKLTLTTPKGRVLLDRLFQSSSNIVVNANHAISASEQMYAARQKLFDDVISAFFFASHADAVNKMILESVDAQT